METELKIGDRVYVRDNYSRHNGWAGELIFIGNCNTWPYGVEFEDGSYEPFSDSELDLVESTEEPKPKALPPAFKLTGTDRKMVPIYHGVLMYFPKAIQEIARLSFMANEQHNPGTEMHWDRDKSGDELDAGMRHAVGCGTFDEDGQRHSTKTAWRFLANLEKELEAAQE